MAGRVDRGLTHDYHSLSLAKNQVQWRQGLSVISHSKQDHTTTGIMSLGAGHGSTTKRQMITGIAGKVYCDIVN